MIKKTKLGVICTLILCSVALTSCGGSPTPKPSESYTITWKNDDGSILKQDKHVIKGSMPEYIYATPTKKSSAQYSYTFSHWEPSLVPVTCDATYTAKYESHIRSYEIEWQDDEGHTLKKETLKYGEMPNYGSTPTKESTAQYEYHFTGWSPNITTVIGPAIYKATFSSTIRKHAITWKRDDGTTLRTDYVEYDKMPNYGSTPSKSSTDEYDYEFDYWSPSISKVTGPATYTAHFKSFRKYLITWKNYNDSTLATDRVREGQTPHYSGSTPSKPSTAQYTYSFSGWNPSITTATCDKTYTAQFSSTIRSYEIIWEDDNGTVLKKETLIYGSHPSYGSTPSKPSTDDYDYEFASWSPSITEVTGPATYRATYNSFRKYLITWKNYNDSTLAVDRVREGRIPSYGGSTPTKPNPDEHHESKFTGWSPSVTAVIGPATYKATFETIGKKYAITWKMDDGSTLRTDQVEYDKMPDYGEAPKKDSTAQYDYTFTGWNPTITKVIGPATYVATFSSKIRSYDINWVDGDGQIIKTDHLDYGAMPSYTGPTPTKTPSAQYNYQFTGWDSTITIVTESKTYTAQFSESPREYKVTVTSEDESKGTVSGSGIYAYGSSVTISATPKTGYSFGGWYNGSLQVSIDASYTFTMPIDDVNYTAKFYATAGPWYQRYDWWNYCSNGKEGEQATISDIGKEVELTVNNQVHKVRLIGIDHDDLYKVSGQAHCTFEFSNLLSDSSGYSLATLWNTSNGKGSTNYDYLNSDLRKALDGHGAGTLRWYQKGSSTKSEIYTEPIINMLPNDLKDNIKTVNKVVATYSSDYFQYICTNYDAKIFALTYREMTKTHSDHAKKEEGSTYQYYKDHDNDSSRIKHQIKWHDGAITDGTIITDPDITWTAYNYAGHNHSAESAGSGYWLASPDTYDSTWITGRYDANKVTQFGGFDHSMLNIFTSCIAPAFCI